MVSLFLGDKDGTCQEVNVWPSVVGTISSSVCFEL